MSLNRYAKKRDKSEKALVEYLRASGCTVYLTDQPTDAIVGFQGQTFIVEFKTGNKPLNENQKKFIDEWKGAPVIVMRTIEDAKALIDEALTRAATCLNATNGKSEKR